MPASASGRGNTASRPLLEPLGVSLQRIHVPEHVRRRVLDGRDDRIRGRRQGVVHPEPFAPRGDEPGAAQVGEVSRGLGLRDLQRVVDVADADLARHQQAQDAESRRVRQRLEQRLELREL
jgi:hypothetical protein